MSQELVVRLLVANGGKGTIPKLARDGLAAGYYSTLWSALNSVRTALVRMERYGEVHRLRPQQRRGVEHVWILPQTERRARR